MKLEQKAEEMEGMVVERIKELADDGTVDLSKSSTEYEKIIQKLEAEVRNHISVQQQMKLYIESYQTKIEELEPLEDKSVELSTQISKMEESNYKLQSDIEELKTVNKERKAEWKLREQEFKNMINKNQTKQHYLESKVKDLEIIIKTNRTFSGSAEKERSTKHFTNNMETRTTKGELILVKDESFKINNDNKIKYMLKNIPGGSVKANDDPEDAFISFSELSTKTPDKAKISSMKKGNPYKIEYFKHHPDIFENLKNDIKINRNGRINVNPNYSRANYNNSEIDDKHKRSKSQTMNSIKSKKVSTGKLFSKIFLIFKSLFLKLHFHSV
jgi:myosin heavy subunit